MKIASKALENRVKKVIPKLIAVDQTAYVKGRFIGESIRVINDLIEHIKLEGDKEYCSPQTSRKLSTQLTTHFFLGFRKVWIWF